MNNKLKFTKYQKITEVLSILSILFLITYLVINLPTIPNQIPSHYNALGVVDAWSDRNFIFKLPIAGFVLYLLLTVISFFPSSWNIPVKLTKENEFRILNITRSLLCTEKLIMILIFTYMTVCITNAVTLGPFFLLIAMLAIFGTMLIFIIIVVKSVKLKL